MDITQQLLHYRNAIRCGDVDPTSVLSAFDAKFGSLEILLARNYIYETKELARIKASTTGLATIPSTISTLTDKKKKYSSNSILKCYFPPIILLAIFCDAPNILLDFNGENDESKKRIVLGRALLGLGVDKQLWHAHAKSRWNAVQYANKNGEPLTKPIHSII